MTELLSPYIRHSKGAMLSERRHPMPTKTNQKRGSYKQPGVQALVIERSRAGESMRQIARECRLDRSTVKNILTQPDVKEALALARRTVIAALPAISEMVTTDVLKQRDRELGFQVLKRSGAFPTEEEAAPMNTLLQDNRLQIAIQTLLPPVSPSRGLQGDS
jgi:hypothetical protein